MKKGSEAKEEFSKKNILKQWSARLHLSWCIFSGQLYNVIMNCDFSIRLPAAIWLPHSHWWSKDRQTWGQLQDGRGKYTRERTCKWWESSILLLPKTLRPQWQNQHTKPKAFCPSWKMKYIIVSIRSNNLFIQRWKEILKYNFKPNFC